MRFAKDISLDETTDAGFNFSFGAKTHSILEYVTQIMCWERLTQTEEDNEGFKCAKYWEDHVLALDAKSEAWPAEMIVGFDDGTKVFELLALRLNSDPSSGMYQQAVDMVWQMLGQASMEKVYHGHGITSKPSLGTLWEMPDNFEKDNEPGTFAELLRYGTLHFKQTRREVKVLPPHTKPRIFKSLHEP